MQPGARHHLFTAPGGDAAPLFRIGLSPIPVEHWFEGGEAAPAARKDALLGQSPALVWGETDGSRPAQAEALRMVRAWLDERGDAPVAPLAEDAPPLWAASRLLADDLCLMQRRPSPEGDEAWTLTAASLCAATFFTAAEAVGLPMHGLHGPVPGFNAALLNRVTRIFDHLPADQLLERRNWTLTHADALFLPDAAAARAELSELSSAETGARLLVRRERQSLRRLPESGALLFSIRIWREPLGELLADPARRAAFAQAWARLLSDEGEPFRNYKGLAAYDAAVRTLLDD